MALAQSFAGNEDSLKAHNSGFHYAPLSEAEVQEVIKNPLSLEDCIRIALRKNVALGIAEGDLLRAEALHAGSFGQFLPVFTLEGSKVNSQVKEPDSLAQFQLVQARFDNQATVVGKAQLYVPTGATLELTNDFFRKVSSPFGQPVTRNDNRTYSVSLTQPLLRGAGPKIARNAVISTEYDRKSQENLLLNTKLETVFSVKRAYYFVLQVREQIQVNQATLRSDSVLIKASEALVLAKLATRRDVLSAEIRYADDRAALIRTQTVYQNALDNLKGVMGIPIEMPIALDSTRLSYAPITLDEQALVQKALENNPRIQSARLAIQNSKLQHSVAKNTLLPKLDVVASYSSASETDLVLNRDLSRTGGWQARLNLSYSFLSRDAGAKAENAQIFVSQQEDRLLDLQRQITLTVRNVVRSVYSAVEEIEAIKRSIEVAEEKLAFANTMFSLGRASNLDITDAQEFLLGAQNFYLEKVVDVHTLLAQLESLTGEAIAPAR
jgi:outer membrane protein TolC